MNDTMAIEQFRNAMNTVGITPPDRIVSDGQIHRFATNGKPGDDAGWYFLDGDDFPAGAFGDWRTGVSETWRVDVGGQLTAAEQQTVRVRMDAVRRVREAEEAERHAKAAKKAATIWQSAEPATPNHPYLRVKGVQPHGVRVHAGQLVVPLRDGPDLCSLQIIAQDGTKRFLTGGRVHGCYFLIGEPDSVLHIAEGYATAASIHGATGSAVATAFNAGNLQPTAKALRIRFPNVRLIICADDDAETEGNPGLSKAREAARSVGALLAVPDFGNDRPDCATDFNDLLRHVGPEAVRACIERAAPVAPADGTADYLQQAHDIASMPGGRDRDDKLRRLIYDLTTDRDADPLVRARVRDHITKDAKLLPAGDWAAQVKHVAGRESRDTTTSDDKPTLTAKLPDLVDIVQSEDGRVEFLRMEGGKPVVTPFVIGDDGARLVPPPRDKVPFPLVSADAVLRHFEGDTDAELFDDLLTYHRNISDVPEAWYLLLVVWDFHTWTLETANYSPIVVFYAVAERGKSRTLHGMFNVAYRGIITESLRESYLARFTDSFGGTVLFDVMDLWKKADRAGSEDIVLQRFERGAMVPRVNKPEAGPFLDTDYYSVFGATVVATNEPLHHILDTRALTLTMQESSRRFLSDVRAEDAADLRARLTAFRARHLGESLPAAEKPVGGRLGDICGPLVQMVRLVRPDREDELLALIRDIDRERRSSKSDTTDGEIVKALRECEDDVTLEGTLRVSSVRERVNAGRADDKGLSSQFVGKRLRALGLQAGARTSGGNTVVYDCERVSRLVESYGLTDTRVLGETPHSSHSTYSAPAMTASGEECGECEELSCVLPSVKEGAKFADDAEELF